MATDNFKSQAQYYSGLPIITKAKASIHLEDENDKIFWKAIFDKFFPTEKFHYIPYSKSADGNDTSGCEQCLNYRPYLNKRFLICIDSDYRYLLQEADLDIDHFIFQTYTYSFENHLCVSEGLDTVCKLSCNFDNIIYNFKQFFEEFSAIIYELFIWHIALLRNNPVDFNKDEFCQLINLCHIDNDIQNQSKMLLDELRARVDTKIVELQTIHTGFDLEGEKQKYLALGVEEKNVYLYIRGHNLFTLCSSIGREVCENILSTEKAKLAGNPASIGALYRARKYFDTVINQNILFSTYPEITKIENDITKYKTI